MTDDAYDAAFTVQRTLGVNLTSNQRDVIRAAIRGGPDTLAAPSDPRKEDDMSEFATIEKEEAPVPQDLTLLRADPHRWGVGLVHLIDLERDQTMCGKSPGGCPGTRFNGTHTQITCRSCLRSIEAKARWEEENIKQEKRRREWEAAEREREAAEREREEYTRNWWSYYDAYLLTPVWQVKREKVLLRANGWCEGCDERKATQAHHLKYPQYCRPGSPEWIMQEKLFDLRAVCDGCHRDIHATLRVTTPW